MCGANLSEKVASQEAILAMATVFPGQKLDLNAGLMGTKIIVSVY